MIAVAQLLLGTPLSPEQRELAEMLLDSGASLLTVLGDCLDYACIEKGSLTLKASPVWLRDAVENCLEAVTPDAAARNVSLSYRLSPSLAKKKVVADPVRCRQVLACLLSNAVKFNKEGGEVEVEIDIAAVSSATSSGIRCSLDASAKAAASKGGRKSVSGSYVVKVSVRDSGVGIDAKEMKRLFEGFAMGTEQTYQDYMRRRHGGTGKFCFCCC